MKKLLIAFVVGLTICGTASAAYQVYDVKLTLNTTRAAHVSIPYPLNLLFGSSLFRQKAKETLSGMVVCWGSDRLSNPSFMYLRSSETGKTYLFGRTLNIDWPVYNRLSPSDKIVECAWELSLSNGSGDSYSITGGGVGKIKNLKYNRWWGKGTYITESLDTFKGELAGYKTTASPHGVTVDGTASMGSARTAIYGSWQIKLNKNYTDAIYRLSTSGNNGGSSKGGTGSACSDDGDKSMAGSDDGEELTAETIAAALGL